MAELRVCFLGESYVNGTGDPACLGWAGRVCRAAVRRGHDVTYYNLGIRRETTVELRARWRQEAERRQAAGADCRLVFSFGVNDTAVERGQVRVSTAASLANARTMLAEARACYPVLLVGPPPVADATHTARIARLSEQLAAVVAPLDVPYLEVCAPLRASRTWMREVHAGDGAHPGAAGYAALARLIEHWPAWRAWVP